MNDFYGFIFAAAQEQPFIAGAGLNLVDVISNIDFILELAVEGINQNLS